MNNYQSKNQQNLEQELRRAHNKIIELEAENAEIKNSKFWKIRNLWIKIKSQLPWQLFIRYYQKLKHKPAKSFPATNYQLPQPLPSGYLSILLIVEESIEHCFRYRVQQKIEQLKTLGYKTNWVSWKQPELARKLVHFHHIIIFYRVSGVPDVITTIKLAKQLNKIVIFDVDDLIFVPELYPEPFANYKSQLSLEEYQELVRGVQLYYQALSHCDFAIASTPTLKTFMTGIVGVNNAFCHRNCLDQPILNFVKRSPPKCHRDYLSIFYGSGTRTHDADLSLVAPAIANLLNQHSQLRLTLIGHLTLPSLLEPYSLRIDRVPFLDSAEAYWQFLSQADINIAPLTDGEFNNCKSEIKWLEAAILGIPSVVSATQTYNELLEDGKEVFLASSSEEWEEKLNQLILDESLRRTMAEKAQEKANKDYSPEMAAQQLQTIIGKTIEQATHQGTVLSQAQKIRLLFVHVLYPPQALGGATAILKQTIDYLHANYGDRYELFVFTTDWESDQPYQITSETLDGVYVTRIKIPERENLDWHSQNSIIYQEFSAYLESIQPDLIHFHCVQILTASTLEAADDYGFPYLVTLHDAWWLGDYQFLIDENGNLCDSRLNDPLVVARYSKNISLTLKRQRYLANQLKKAQMLLAVSQNQAELYRQNGFPETSVSRNGVIAPPRKPEKSSNSQEVHLGYAGGICTHKGYYLLKSAIKKANLQQTTLTVIDLFITSGEPRWEKWGNTPVKFIPKFPREQMPEFYHQIDVLVAPSIWPESFGLITREATLAGNWVVASNLGALAEDIKSGVHGEVFSPDHPEELIAILQKIDRAPQTYKQPIPREKTTHIRTLDEQVEELHSLYQELTTHFSSKG